MSFFYNKNYFFKYVNTYIGVYLNNKVCITNLKTNNLKTLNKEECQLLLKEYKNGNLDAKNQIVMGNLKLILSVIKKLNYNKNIDLDDLFQIGCIGLIKSIDNFNCDLNVAFSTYAIPMIIGEIKRYIRDNNNVKISRQIKDLSYKILKVKEEFIIKNNKEPSLKELSLLLNEEQFKIDEAIQSLNCVVSLSDCFYNNNGEEMTYIDYLSEDYNYKSNFINRNTLNNGIDKLDNISKNIIKKRYYDGLTQEEIANELFISQAQVSRLEKNAISKLKKLF